MFHLSDNELDRLSREAASQHDPGDPLGPQSWERLSLRLDKELGRAGPDTPRGFRGIRRWPFQYAPVLILVVGVAWYFVKAKGRKTASSGSPPLTVVNTPQHQPGTYSDSSLKNPAYSDKSTSTLYQDAPNGAPPSTSIPAPSDRAYSGQDHVSSGLANSSNPNSTASGPAGSSSPDHRSPGSADHSSPGNTSSGQDHASSGLAAHSGSHRTSNGLHNLSAGDHHASGPGSIVSRRSPGRGRGHNADHTPTDTAAGANGLSGSTGDRLAQSSVTPQPGGLQPNGLQPGGLAHAFIQRPISLRTRPGRISDSALRAYTAKSASDQDKKAGPSLHINRSLTFGFQIAPDFTSVNSLAGDKPGSSLGLTVDYNFLDRWHIGTGILFSRKNFTARGMDYHLPPGYYQQTGLKPVDFVKGTMNMLEIPIDLRYDFSRAGNTIFFASAGVSSYIFGTEHSNYYFDNFGREQCRDFHYSNTPNGLFSSVNLSLGVEAGVSNSVSVLVAPYMKLPTSNIGFGKVRMNSVGINFAVRYSPVISRKRKY